MTAALTPTDTVYDAALLARGWLSVAVASAKDDARPALNRTVAVEAFPTGVRLIATDGFLLLRSWVPNWAAGDLEPEPALDELPIATAVVPDPHGRAAGLLAHALKLAADAGELGPRLKVRLRLGVTDTTPGTLEGLEATLAVLELDDQAGDTERLAVATFDGEFVNWRPMTFATVPAPADAIVLNPDIVARLGKLGKLLPSSLLAFRWSGPDRAATVTLTGAEPSVEGLVMPVRWDIEANRPADTPTAQTSAPVTGPPSDEAAADYADRLEAAARLITSTELGSTAMIQRKLRIGFAEAGRIMDDLEELGIVGPRNGTRPRAVHVTADDLDLDAIAAHAAGIGRTPDEADA